MILKKSKLKLVKESLITQDAPKKFEFDKEDATFFANIMQDKMQEFEVVGLAAKQVGLNIQYIGMNNQQGTRLDIFNPEILWESETKIRAEENSAYYKDLFVSVDTPRTIKVKYQNASGEWIEQDLSDITAKVFIHCYNYMMGITLQKRVSGLKWSLAYKKYLKRVNNLKKVHKIV